ncbi:SGNH hydrolase-type esterase domain-containing protein [Podospora didyma]|uniref:SGNH hydrolase-type esterase domain-containing protein n=1 Tax=Podospora didyma TaxID=330526 RepID=A0AAE0K048_9PEZI|nr:SGNH hydrolase-type esterase domain-containing protein [Podospora didyma]
MKLQPLPTSLLVIGTFGSANGTVPGASRANEAPTAGKKYLALGDSFAEAIGAGRFIDPNLLPDGENHNRCARMDGSYPMQFLPMMKDLVADPIDFFACSGDKLDNIDNQLNKLTGNTVDIVSLSISGNDFFFNDVIHVSTFTRGGAKPAQEVCDKKIEFSDWAIKQEETWEKYRAKVKDMRNHNPGGKIYITGYARFWSIDMPPSNDDECSRKKLFHTSSLFPDWFPNLLKNRIGTLMMAARNRRLMNFRVLDINDRIGRQSFEARYPIVGP